MPPFALKPPSIPTCIQDGVPSPQGGRGRPKAGRGVKLVRRRPLLRAQIHEQLEQGGEDDEYGDKDEAETDGEEYPHAGYTPVGRKGQGGGADDHGHVAVKDGPGRAGGEHVAVRGGLDHVTEHEHDTAVDADSQKEGEYDDVGVIQREVEDHGSGGREKDRQRERQQNQGRRE